MNTQMLTLSTEGQLVIPADVRAELGIEPGSRISLTVENERIILIPVNQRLVGRLRGRFAGGASMADELQRERRAQPLEEDDLDQLAGSLSSSPGMAEELQRDRRREKR